jgi:hypothetical protein
MFLGDVDYLIWELYYTLPIKANHAHLPCMQAYSLCAFIRCTFCISTYVLASYKVANRESSRRTRGARGAARGAATRSDRGRRGGRWTDARRVRSRPTGRVRSLRELTRLQPDAGTVTSGQFSSASGRCFVGARFLFDQRIRSVTGPARLVKPGASGRLGPARPVVLHGATSASGPRDQRIRSAWQQRFQVPNGSIRRDTSINTRWPAQSSRSCTLWHTCEHFELSNSHPTHLSCFFAYSKWDWVIQVYLHCEIASS